MHLLLRLFLIALVVAGSCGRHEVLADEVLSLDGTDESALISDLRQFEPPDPGQCGDQNSCGTGGGR